MMDNQRIVMCYTQNPTLIHELHRNLNKPGVILRVSRHPSPQQEFSTETQQLQSVNLMPVDQLIVIEPAKLGIGDVARILQNAALSKVPACIYVVPNHAVETPQDQSQRELFEKILEAQGAKIFHSPAQYADYLDRYDVLVDDVPDAGAVDEWKSPVNE